MKMTPECNEQQHRNLVGRCPVCQQVANTSEEKNTSPQMKSLKDSENLRKILP